MPKETTLQLKLLQDILNHLPGVHFQGMYDGHYTLSSISDSCETLTGYCREELSGKEAVSLMNLVHPDDRLALAASHKLQFESGLPFVNEFRIVTRGADIKWLLEITSYQNLPDGKGIQIEGVAQDITPFKTGVGIANALLSYQNAVNSASIVSITDTKGKIIFANALFCRVSQYSVQELIGANHKLINSGYHPKAFFEHLWQEILSGRIWRGQICNKAKDGSIYWVDTIIAPVLNDKGVISQFLSIRYLITEQKEIEYNLRESEALNRSVLASLNTSIAILDEKGTVLKTNPSWTAFAKSIVPGSLLSAETGSNCFELIEKAEKDGDTQALLFKKGILDVLNNHTEVFELEYHSTASEYESWLLVHVSKFENDVKRLVLSYFDITERKHQEAIILKSQARLLEAQRIAHIGSWELDIKINKLFWSDENYRIFEIEKTGDDASYETFLDLVHPEDREEVNKAYTSSVKNHKPYDIVHRVLFRDGRIKYIHEQCETIYDRDGNPLRSIGTAQDITAQKESEILLENQRIRFESVVENISDGLIIDDIDGKVVFANKQFLDMIGIQEEDLSTFVFDDFVTPEYKDIIRKRHIQRMKGEDVSTIFEYIGFRKDGSRRWFEARVTKILHGDKIIGTQSAIRDITDAKAGIDLLKASESEKTNLLNELNQRYNELMQFNYIVSHNLRAPIANIIGLSDMFNMTDTDEEERQQIIAHIQSSIVKIDELISDLNIILAARSDIHSRKERMNFAEIVQRIEKTLEMQIRDSNTKITLEIADDAQEIYSIKSFIKSCLYNLVNNAIKYRMQDTEPRIGIVIRKTGNMIEIRVSDNGIGIDLVKHGRDIFGLYKRFHPSFEGKGLGLNMTKTQVESLGGTIRIESRPGMGSTFIILLPENEDETPNQI